ERLDRGDVDDTALAGAQGFEEGMRHVEHAIEIDGHDVVPVLDHGRRLAGKSVAAIDAGIVDENRDLADLLADAPCDLCAIGAPRDIEPEACRAAAGPANFICGLLDTR